MPFSSPIVPAVYTGDGTATPRAFGWKITDESDLVVIVKDTTDNTDNGTVLTLNAANGYTVAGVGVAAGGTITFTGTYATSVTSDFKIMIRDRRNTVVTSDQRNNSDYNGADIQATFEQLGRDINTLREDMALTLKFYDVLDDQAPGAVTNGELPVPLANTIPTRNAANNGWDMKLLSAMGATTFPASTTDNALIKADGVTGLSYQATAIIVDDSNNITGVVGLTLTGNLTLSGDILDSAGNELIKFTETASAVNEITITNKATGAAPTIDATGDDANIDLILRGKGTGAICIPGAGSNSTRIGSGAVAGGTNSTVTGEGATDGSNANATVNGRGAGVTGANGTAVGQTADAAQDGTALGQNANAAQDATAAGKSSNVAHAGSIGIGKGSTSTKIEQLVIGSTGDKINEVLVKNAAGLVIDCDGNGQEFVDAHNKLNRYKATAITGATTGTINTYHTLANSGGGDYTVTLPAAGTAGRLIAFQALSGLTEIVTIDGNGTETIDGALYYKMAAGDYLLLRDNGTNWDIVDRKGLVYVRATSNAGQVVTAATTDLQYEDEVLDTHGAWATDVFTAPRDGKYVYTANAIFSLASLITLEVEKNSSSYVFAGNPGSAILDSVRTLSCVLELSAGDQLRLHSNISATRNTYASGNTICIAEVTS